jgi:hypothetical protein
MVLEAPPMVFGGINDIWFRWVIDLGITCPDNGEGGRYLLLPLGYKVTVSDGYHVVNSPTFNIWLPWRRLLVNGDPKPGVDLVKKFTKIYPFPDADKPAPTLTYVNVSEKNFLFCGSC